MQKPHPYGDPTISTIPMNGDTINVNIRNKVYYYYLVPATLRVTRHKTVDKSPMILRQKQGTLK